MLVTSHPGPSVLPSASPAESATTRRFGLLVLLCLLIGYALLMRAIWYPANIWVDQHGDLQQAKVLAQNGAVTWTPRDPLTGQPDPLQFVGRQFIGLDLGTAAERYVVKYPLGVALIFAGAIRAAGQEAPFWVGPIATITGLIAAFAAARRLVGTVGGLFVTAILMTSPVLLFESVQPRGHGLSFAIWSVAAYGLLCWRQRPSWCVGLAVGVIAGTATWVRYTDALLVLPMGYCLAEALFHSGSERARLWRQSGGMLLAWAVPVLMLVLWNQHTFGMVSGYGVRGDSTDFSWTYLIEYGRERLGLLYGEGLPGFFPFALLAVGGCILWRPRDTQAARAGWLLGIWALPTLGVYLLYSFTRVRFYIPAFLPLALALVLLVRLAAERLLKRRQDDAAWRSSRILLALGAALLCGGVAFHGTAIGLRQGRSSARLARQCADVGSNASHVRESNTAFFVADLSLLNHLQYATDALLYDDMLFKYALSPRGTPDRPQQCSDPVRAAHIREVVQRLQEQGPSQVRAARMGSLLQRGYHVVVLRKAKEKTIELAPGVRVVSSKPVGRKNGQVTWWADEIGTEGPVDSTGVSAVKSLKE